MSRESKKLIDRFVTSIGFIRKEFLVMDKMINPVMGIGDWDDAVIVDFGGKNLVVSCDGPYTKRLVMKSALIHATTDVVVKGARPLFALDTLIGKKEDVSEMVESLKRQAQAMKIPILGGNTLFEEAEPRCSLTVVGEMLLDEPLRDNNAKKADLLLLMGEPIWGSQPERIQKAKKLFKTWFTILKKAKINSAKDVTKGGLISVIYEMEKKSGRKFSIKGEIPFSLTRNLDNFIVSLPKSEFSKVEKICKENKCPLVEIGAVL